MSPKSYPFVIRNAVDQSFVDHVIRLIGDHQDQFEVNGDEGSRKFLHMDFVTPEGDRVLFDTKEALAERYELGSYVVPPKLKDFIGYLTEGGFIHPHRDQDLAGKRHVRINVLVSRAAGCVPVLDDVPIDVGVGDAWLNLASVCRHATTPVEGPGFRSAISFGFQIEQKRGDALYEIHRNWLAGVRQESIEEILKEA